MARLGCFLCVFLVCFASVAGGSILVMGGNGFIGSEYVHRLLEREKSAEITLLNRGNQYWDSSTRIKPRTNHILCNRDEIRQCEALIASKKSFDLVVDFSSYRIAGMGDVIELLSYRIGFYIYVSTDSVYDVTLPADNYEGKRRENDAVRPASLKERRKLAAGDDYGHRKMGSEELLAEQRENGGFPFAVVRLPDVIGPRDNTDRWWAYQLWLETHDVIGWPVYMTEDLANQQLSFVYSSDVADSLLWIGDEVNRELMNGETVNLAFEENPTLKELLYLIGEQLGISAENIHFSENTVRSYLFPSVMCGPIDINKAQQMMQWKPTMLNRAVKEIVQFYKRAMTLPQFAEKRRQVIDYFKSNWVPHNKHNAFNEKLLDIYPQLMRDEL